MLLSVRFEIMRKASGKKTLVRLHFVMVLGQRFHGTGCRRLGSGGFDGKFVCSLAADFVGGFVSRFVGAFVGNFSLLPFVRSYAYCKPATCLVIILPWVLFTLCGALSVSDV